MENRNKIYFFRKKLLEWYGSNKREFPWRKDNISNYELIISEILLQRTKAETVANYYQTFFEKYPDWDGIKNASIEDLENILKPLGLYKHRAKRLYKIITEYNQKNGKLPQKSSELNDSNLSSLYIANAYELFILNKRTPLLDVNMSRVLNRFFDPKEVKDVRHDKKLQEFAKTIINVKHCKNLNWAILDFAAIICKSRNPKCLSCPINSKCKFYTEQDKYQQTDSDEPQLNIYYDKRQTDLKSGKKYRLLSLFSGCGGMDLGFEGDFLIHEKCINKIHNPDFIQKNERGKLVRLKPTKFQTVFANDIINNARNAWVNFFKGKGYSSEIFHLESIVDLVKLHKKGIKIFPDKIDIVTGGFPCQDFSVSGLRNGFKSQKDHTGELIGENTPSIETRGQLYMWMKEVIDIVQPKIFIAENVKGLVNLSNVKDIIQRDFARANGNGYLVLAPQVLHAANYGVPQSRERVFFIGLKRSELKKDVLKELEKEIISDKFSPYPSPSHSQDNNLNGYVQFVKLKDIFKNLDEPENSLDPSQMYFSKAKYMGKHCQGQTEINPDSISPTIRAEHHGNIEFRRLSSEHGGKISDELRKGLAERRLTPRECALIQTFPYDYEFVIPSQGKKFFISPSSAYKLIGNAVPPLLAYHIAKKIEKQWDKYFKN